VDDRWNEPTDPATGVRAGERYDHGGFAEARVKGDRNITVTDVRIRPTDIRGEESLVGQVMNNYDKPLSSLKLSIALYDTDHRRIIEQPFELSFMPPKSTLRFSLDYSLPTGGKVAAHQASAFAIPADQTVASWMIDPEECMTGVDSTGDVFILTGLTRNNTTYTITDVKIYVDFLSDEDIHLGMGIGKLDDSKRLPPRKSARFTVRFDTAKHNTFPDAVTKWIPRLWGKKVSNHAPGR